MYWIALKLDLTYSTENGEVATSTKRGAKGLWCSQGEVFHSNGWPKTLPFSSKSISGDLNNAN